jgi:hypothetical protein
VISTVTRPTTATSRPISEKTEESKAVCSLKCEGTPRHFCIEIRKTSPIDATDSVPIRIQPVSRRVRMKVINQVNVSSVMPKDRPNTIGFRHETGPVQEPPSTR